MKGAGLKLTFPERVAALEERLAIRFAQPELALSALIHKSWLNEHPREQLTDNERLEFLGDAVVDLAIGHRLMERLPLATEGELSRARALLVSEEGLGRVAAATGIAELLLLGKGEERNGGRSRPGLLGDALEAVIGALFLSEGLPAVMELVDRLFREPLELVVAGRGGADFKTRLQERTQERLRQAPRYLVVAESGPEHAKVFEVEVQIGDTAYARATGRNKKEAEQAAARETFRQLFEPDPAG